MASGDVPVRVRGLNHYYGRGALRKQILFEIHTEIQRGEIVIATGPSGSGKTTLLTLIGALRSAQEGSVMVLGQELAGASPRVLESVRRQIGFIFQQHNLIASLSALENVELGLRVTRRYRGAALRRTARDMLAAVGLAERMDYRAESLSGGQRQRVAIARALAAQPAMVLADEPTASLDSSSGREVVDRMQDLARSQGTTILMVTHDNRILDVADRIIHLEDGRLSRFTDSVLANNQHMMGLLARSHEKEDLRALVDDLDENGFRQLLQQLDQESQRVLEATSLANNQVFRSLLEQGLFASTRKLAQLFDAERASLFLVEPERGTILLRVSENLPAAPIRIPIGTGIAGAVAATGRPLRVDDAYADSRFNPEVDRLLGYRTRSLLCLPIRDRAGDVFAVAQLLNRRDGRPFAVEDETRLAGFLDSLGVMLQSLHGQVQEGAPA